MLKLLFFIKFLDIPVALWYNINIKLQRMMHVATKKQVGGRLFRFFDFNRDNRPDALEEDTTPTLKRYFKVLGRRFWKLISLNLMMLPMVLPLLLMYYIYIYSDMTPIQNDLLFSQFYGAASIEPSVSTTLLLDLFGAQREIAVFDNTLTYVLIALCALFLLVTWGWQNVGATYILRSFVRGEPVFLFSDFFYAIRRNLKQGLLLGIIDIVAIFLLVFDFTYFMGMPSTFWTDVCYFAILVMVVLYFLMRFYIYLQLITFDISLRKIFKNALIFTALGMKRNIMAVLGIALYVAIEVVLFALFSLTPLGIAIPLILPMLYFLSFTSFTSAYAAFPVIDRYMIAPHQSEYEDDEEEGDEDEESQSTDGGEA